MFFETVTHKVFVEIPGQILRKFTVSIKPGLDVSTIQNNLVYFLRENFRRCKLGLVCGMWEISCTENFIVL